LLKKKALRVGEIEAGLKRRQGTAFCEPNLFDVPQRR
jgi:hypothetical protein